MLDFQYSGNDSWARAGKARHSRMLYRESRGGDRITIFVISWPRGLSEIRISPLDSRQERNKVITCRKGASFPNARIGNPGVGMTGLIFFQLIYKSRL